MRRKSHWSVACDCDGRIVVNVNYECYDASKSSEQRARCISSNLALAVPNCYTVVLRLLVLPADVHQGHPLSLGLIAIRDTYSRRHRPANTDVPRTGNGNSDSRINSRPSVSLCACRVCPLEIRTFQSSALQSAKCKACLLCHIGTHRQTTGVGLFSA